ncbi:MAG TPA: hypothetical protein VEZ14_10730 [Dehalococcoidia bacterium]|nr:hypothetical protein [Dehalococcoidia bacterium]
MYTENGLLVDLGDIEHTVANADVFAVGFRVFPERLLIDTRHDEREMPMVAIVDPVGSVQERFFWLGQHRPTLGMPQSFMFFFWPHSARFLEESGLWATIRKRVESSGFSGAGETCEAALRDLTARERAANVDAVRGQRYQTLWSAS